jgi:hypothetical protein
MAAGAVGTAMNLVDATSGAQARVDAGHNLHTAVADPAGVNVAKVDSGKNLHTAIADPGGVNVAKVDAKGNVNTALHDAVSGTAAKVNSLGQVSAVVTGTVTANAGVPNPSESGQVNVGAGWTPVIRQSLAGLSQVLTALHVDTWAVTPGVDDAIQFALSTNNCLSAGPTLDAVNPGGIGVTQLDFVPGLLLASGVALCAINNDPANLQAAVFAYYH